VGRREQGTSPIFGCHGSLAAWTCVGGEAKSFGAGLQVSRSRVRIHGLDPSPDSLHLTRTIQPTRYWITHERHQYLDRAQLDFVGRRGASEAAGSVVGGEISSAKVTRVETKHRRKVYGEVFVKQAGMVKSEGR
jgi:hypothetical protein